MEITGITNYTFDEFLLLDVPTATSYISFLEWLEPIQEFDFAGEIIYLKELASLEFGQVNIIREDLSHPTPESLTEVIHLITGLEIENVREIPIIDFYGILNQVKGEAEKLSLIEAELSGEPDIDFEMVNGPARMSQFGVLNVLDALSGGDLTKYEQIERMPYLLVIAKLKMNKETAAINRAILSLQKQRQNNQ